MLQKEKIEIIKKKNKCRHIEINKPYDPISGVGSTAIPRVCVQFCDAPLTDKLYVPKSLLKIPIIRCANKHHSIASALIENGLHPTEENILEVWKQFILARIEEDFEFWAFSFVLIKDKETPYDIPFKLNRGQRKLLKAFEELRLANKPIRIILLKARQWGGSTLTQIYIAWLQLVKLRQWSSVICAHTENTARAVRGMYSKLLENYPMWLCEGATDRKDITFSQFEGSQKTKRIKFRDCKISIGSAVKPEGLRGLDVACAHLSEIGLYPSTINTKPEDLVQGIISGVMSKPNTIVVYESTAKGVGNFFHREWLRALASDPKERSGFTPVFVSWFDIDSYSAPIDDIDDFINSLTEYELQLFEDGATLEAIAWYRIKEAEYPDRWRFVSEYPSNAVEAFQSTGSPFYSLDLVERLKSSCIDPPHVGDITGADLFGETALHNIKFIPNINGMFKVWNMPSESEMVTDRYLVVVDIGGLSATADNSVICVFDRYWQHNGGVPEVVAEWCGHIPHYRLAWMAAQIATWYHNALLVIESNTLESHQTEGYHGEYILDEISHYYHNLYCRTSAEQIKQGLPARWGFHTNTQTKTLVCDHQRKVLEHSMYIERCIDAVYEHQTLEIRSTGKIEATDGCRDDRHITRAIGNYICYQQMRLPQEITSQDENLYSSNITSMATF